jgi:hypothetical protein
MAAGIATALDSTSATWAEQSNVALARHQDELNTDMFGNLKEVTGAVNDSLTRFTDIINNGLNTAFGNTPFMDPLKAVVDCILLNKVEKVQEGLTWVSDHAHITFPTLSNDTFSLSRLASEGSDAQAFISDPQAATNAEISSTLEKISSKLQKSITQEILITVVLMLVYLVVVMMGVGRAIWGVHKGINASHPDGNGFGAGGHGHDIDADGHLAEMPPIDVDEHGNHWVEHGGVQYRIGPDGDYVIGEDGQYITRHVHHGHDDDDEDYDYDAEDIDEHGYVRDDDDGSGQTHDTLGHHSNGGYAGNGPRGEKAEYDEHRADSSHDRQHSDPFDDSFAARHDVPPYPAPSYQPSSLNGAKKA